MIGITCSNLSPPRTAALLAIVGVALPLIARAIPVGTGMGSPAGAAAPTVGFPLGAGSAASEQQRAAAVTEVRTVSGSIRSVDWADRKVTLTTADGPVELEFDRNTSVFLEKRLGTVRQLAVGAPARASFGPGQRAFWIELGTHHPTADREVRRTASGPPVLVPPRPSTSPADAPPAHGGQPGRAGGDVPAGPGTPEPNPGATPVPPSPGSSPAGPASMPSGTGGQ